MASREVTPRSLNTAGAWSKARRVPSGSPLLQHPHRGVGLTRGGQETGPGGPHQLEKRWRCRSQGQGLRCLGIGQPAVLARLEGAPGAVDDFDTVGTQHGDEPTVVESAVAEDGVDGLLNGMKIDCIAVGDIPAAELLADCLPDAEDGRIFVVVQHFALDNAEESTLVAEEDGAHARRWLRSIVYGTVSPRRETL